MKKILAYLLVLVSLMTLFCGMASADTTFSKTTTASVTAPVEITDLDDGTVNTCIMAVAVLRVTATCKYEGNSPLYPVAAWASDTFIGVTNGGGTAVRRGEPSESTQTGYEGGKRAVVEHHYTVTIEATYAPRGSKKINTQGQIIYDFGSKTNTVIKTVQTIIQFYRR